MKLHYYTIGNPSAPNVALILHGTGGSGRSFQSPQFGGELFGKGQPLDASQFFIVMPDGIGHGKSSKPSDGLRALFPKYCYHDMTAANYRLLTEHLGVRVVMGTSMGAMQTWMWGEMYPDFMDALMPLASAPIQIAGRNRLLDHRSAKSFLRHRPGKVLADIVPLAQHPRMEPGMKVLWAQL